MVVVAVDIFAKFPVVLCVCVCERERERERECVCVCSLSQKSSRGFDHVWSVATHRVSDRRAKK